MIKHKFSVHEMMIIFSVLLYYGKAMKKLSFYIPFPCSAFTSCLIIKNIPIRDGESPAIEINVDAQPAGRMDDPGDNNIPLPPSGGG